MLYDMKSYIVSVCIVRNAIIMSQCIITFIISRSIIRHYTEHLYIFSILLSDCWVIIDLCACAHILVCVSWLF